MLRHPDGTTEKVHYVIRHYVECVTAKRDALPGHDDSFGWIRALERQFTPGRWEFWDDSLANTLFTLLLSEHGKQLPVRLQGGGQIIPVGDLTESA